MSAAEDVVETLLDRLGIETGTGNAIRTEKERGNVIGTEREIGMIRRETEKGRGRETEVGVGREIEVRREKEIEEIVEGRMNMDLKLGEMHRLLRQFR